MATDAELERVRHDLERVAVAVRALENLEAPMQSRAVTELRELQAAVTRINERGALATRGELRNIRDRMGELTKDVDAANDELKTKADADVVKGLLEDRKTLTRLVLLAVIGAVLSLVVQLVAKAIGS